MMKDLWKRLSGGLVLAVLCGVLLCGGVLAAPAEGMELVNGSWVQTYTADDGSTHAIYWTRGITPPKMARLDSGLLGTPGYFSVEEFRNSRGELTHRTYEAPMEEGQGYYDLNKQVPADPRCYLAAAGNLIYWWLDQNAAAVAQYRQDLLLGEKFRQGEGLVDAAAAPWDAILTPPPFEVYAQGNLDTYMQYLDHSYLATRTLRRFNDQDPEYSETSGDFPERVFDLFFNGYAPDSDRHVGNRPETYSPHPDGGFFHPIFGLDQIGRKEGTVRYSYYRDNLKNWLLGGQAMIVEHDTPGLTLHAITLWGAEYNTDTGELVRMYVTDSDDYEDLAGSTGKLRGLSSLDVYQDPRGTMYLTTALNPNPQKPGTMFTGSAVLELRQEVMNTVAADREPAHSAVVVQQPKDASYGQGAPVAPLQVRAQLDPRDENTGAYLTYQWYRSEDGTNTTGTPIPGATQSGYTPVVGTQAAEESYYCQVITHKYGKTHAISTRAACVTTRTDQAVNAAQPRFTVNNPQTLRFYPRNGVAPTLEVQAVSPDGGSISYQWYQSNRPNAGSGWALEGQTDPQFTPSLRDEEGTRWYYYCKVVNHNHSPEITGQQDTAVYSNVQYVETALPSDLRITGGPQTAPQVGAVFTLGTQGNGKPKVNWEITQGKDNARMDTHGQVEILRGLPFTVTVTCDNWQSAQLTIRPQPDFQPSHAEFLPDGRLHYEISPNDCTGKALVLAAVYSPQGQLLGTALQTVSDLSQGCTGTVDLSTEPGGSFRIFFLSPDWNPLALQALQGPTPS